MKKRLYRIREGRMIGGICTGLAEYFDMDVTIVRLVWVILFFSPVSALLPYLIGLLVIPERPQNYIDEQ